MRTRLRALPCLLFSLFTALPVHAQFKASAPDDSAFFRSNFEPEPALPNAPTRKPATPDARGGFVPGGPFGEGLSLFGQELFLRTPEGEVSREVYVLPPDYRLGPGDRIGIYLLGKVQKNLEVLVNVEGKIFVPPVGVVKVWGLSTEEFRRVLTRRLARYYDNFQLDLMILQPKNVMVAVVGEVARPGKYVLSAMNTVLDAVIAAGGPTARGSLRDIRLLRQGQPYATVDLYQFLMSGHNEFDVFLEAGDRIWVPLMQSRVSIEGEVRRPAIFELKPGAHETLADLVNMAGGLTEYAYLPKIEISRLLESGKRKVLYVDYTRIAQGDSSANPVLENEDRVRVYSKLDQVPERVVSIFGEVRRPGTYPLEDNMHLSDLILKAGNLTRKAYTLQAEIAKVDPGKPTRFLKVSLEHLGNGVDGQTDILLEEDDQVFIRRIPRWEVGHTVEVQGEVLFPGTYPIVKDSTYLSEILRKAGGFTDDAFLQEALVIRKSKRLRPDKEFERLQEMRREEMTDLEYQYFVMKQNTADVNHIVVDFERLMFGNDSTQDIILENGDLIVVPKAPRVVTVTGSVAKPGGVTYVPGADLNYYLSRAGGISWDADRRKTKVIKVTGEVLEDEDAREFQPGDIIWVPRKTDKKFWPVFLQAVTVGAQLASIYLVIITAIDRSK